MTSPLFIREALPEDAAAVWAVQQAAFLPLAPRLPSRPTALREDEAYWRQHLERVPRRTVVVHVDGELVAAGRVDGAMPQGELKRIAVHPSWQSRGVGRRLVEALEAHARELGFVRLRAGTRKRLPDNQAFYERLGYRVVALEPYPPGIDDHTVWMEKDL
ncbi:GNAT family N-acetyltransferase [Cystobacter fuscus]|uniref:GNAT family N-acetyltransferase n=1 Tax=Cystobacter fuscus TaxID=43 RepID=A0A250J977_9BACT|nr:GNAT family N-acetyltransferase [Cystobacter fuscus]ATB40110.1 GNAT family N-acetyltransferase [Cystobacter fuscus]